MLHQNIVSCPFLFEFSENANLRLLRSEFSGFRTDLTRSIHLKPGSLQICSLHSL